LPLTSILPQGQPGCTLWVDTDLLTTLPVSNRTATFALTVPATASLVGTTFRHQVVPFDLGAAGSYTVTATNALLLQIGLVP
jgi:hypothetical protein